MKIAVALSGGVDSAVAAYLLKQGGHNVLGVTFLLHDDGGESVTDAGNVAKFLGIPHEIRDYRAEFTQNVVKPFISAYLRGVTPNPCVMCNRAVKFEMLLKTARELDCERIATGHYAEIAQLNGRHTLKMARYSPKDQTYALSSLSQEQLSALMLPLFEYSKDDTRGIAKSAGLPVFDKPDSQDICFIPKGDYGAFIAEHAENETTGDFVDANGNVLGKHKGISNYTIGQRKGLGISHSERLFVISIDAARNMVTLGGNDGLMRSNLTAANVNYMGLSDVDGIDEIHCSGKIRYAHTPAPCRLQKLSNGDISCFFDEPQRAVTKGQAAVFYDENGLLLLGGTIL